MTAPEREALVKALRSKAETYDLYGPLDVSATLRKAADLIEALSAAPAVTVTEERCRAVLADQFRRYAIDPRKPNDWDIAGQFACVQAMLAIASEAASPHKSERDAVLEEAARVADAYAANAKTLPRKWATEDVAISIRALKSTTPQTGSQE
jgi:hypothetical protein